MVFYHLFCFFILNLQLNYFFKNHIKLDIMKKLLSLLFVVLFGSMLLSSCGDSKPKELKANLENGKVIYDKSCIACHMTGVAGAAALTDKPRWDAIADKDIKVLHQQSIDGYQGEFGVMPARGACVDCTDQDLFDAINYMMDKAGVAAKK